MKRLPTERAKAGKSADRRGRVSKWEAGLLAGILVIGAVIRLAYIVEIAREPEFKHPPVDAGYHNYWARALATGDWSQLPPDALGRDPMIGSTPFFRPPGYPYFLAFVFKLTGGSDLAPRIVQACIGLLSCFLLFMLGRAAFSRSLGLVAAALMSIYWVFIYFEGNLQGAVLLVFLALCLMHACLALLNRVSWLRALGTGAILGLYALVRPNILLFAPVLVLWGMWPAIRSARRLGKPAWRRWLLLATGATLGAMITIAPATIRNYVVSKQFVLVSANAGVNLYIGLNEKSQGEFVDNLPDLGRFTTCFDYPTIIQGLEDKTGREMSHTQVSRHFAGLARNYVSKNPRDVVALTLKKAALFWTPREITHNYALRYDKEFSKVLRPLPGFLLILSLALVGCIILLGDGVIRLRSAVVTRPNDRAAPMLLLMSLFVLTYFISFLPFFITSLYRVPITPFLILAAAYAVCRACQVAARRTQATLALAAAISFMGLVIGVTMIGLAEETATERATGLARWHYAKGVCYVLGEQPDKAAAHYRKAIEADPNNSRSHNNLATLLVQRKEYPEAMRHFTAAANLNANLVEARLGLGNLLTTLGRFDDAIVEYKRATHMRPNDVNIRYVIANTLTRKGDFEQAVKEYELVLISWPNSADAHCNLGVVLATLSRFDDAIAHYRTAQRLSPNNALVYSNMGIAFECAGKHGEAIKCYERALTTNPNDTRTRQRLHDALKKVSE